MWRPDAKAVQDETFAQLGNPLDFTFVLGDDAGIHKTWIARGGGYCFWTYTPSLYVPFYWWEITNYDNDEFDITSNTVGIEQSGYASEVDAQHAALNYYRRQLA